MYELQRKQQQIEEFRRQIEMLKRGSDSDRVRQVVYQMYNAGLVPQPVMYVMNFLTYISPSTSVNMLSRTLETAARRMM